MGICFFAPSSQGKPQTPKPSFSYYSEEVEYNNADSSVHYGATLTRPVNMKSFPTAIIISGSGSQDRDFSYGGHKFYAVSAGYLTNHGIAVLRVDDKGIGKSTEGNDLKSLTSGSFSKDVETSLNYLESRKDIHRKKIGLIGHSEGGVIAPMVAARRKDVAFIVLWAGPIIGGLQTNVLQNASALRKAGMDSSAVAAFVKLHTRILLCFASVQMNELDTAVTRLFTEWKEEQPKEVLTRLMVSDHTIVGQDIHKIYHTLYDLAWMRFFITYNPATDLSRVACPVSINGTKDTQVDAATNLPLIRDILTESGNKHFQVTPLASLNHLMQTAGAGDFSEYRSLDEPLSPLGLSLIAD